MPSYDHDSIDSDPGPMYRKAWVQEGIRHIQRFLLVNHTWLGIDQSKPQRVLDYACGHGTVSAALLTTFPNAMFRGIDIATSQVKRYNDEAEHLLEDPHPRMLAIQGDLNEPKDPLDEPDWRDFDAAIMSMALHHVQDPVDFLSRLRQRVKSGGSVVVIDWLQKASKSSDGDAVNAGTGAQGMTKLSEGPKIWPGFSLDGISAYLRAAGCDEVDVLVDPEHIDAPEDMRGFTRVFMAKGTVASSGS